ncbi:MAG: hypothetical protein K2Q22_05625 [Cytophagales bacterium]|nr:hypothetical protein [Cytophagales bacterium]
MWSAYLQDEIQVSERLKITPGIRVDLPVVPTDPSQSGLSNNPSENLSPNGSTYTFANSNSLNNHLLGKPVISPRLGFNFDVFGNKKVVIRGGSGLFMGRVPFAWFGYAYYNNGTSFGAIDAKPSGTTPIASDPTQYAATSSNPTASSGNFLNTSLGAGNRREVDFIDPNFKMPYMWKNNLAVDLTLPAEYKLTLEGIYTKTIQDVAIQNININQSPATTYYYAYDTHNQQPIFGAGSLGGTNSLAGFSTQNNYSNVYVLTNTTQGYRYSLTAQLRKTYPMGLDWMAAYTNGQSYDVMNGVRNSMESGWQTNQALNPNNATLAVSNFNINHILVANVGYKKDWNSKHTSYISAVLTMQSGSPYSYGLVNQGFNNSGTQVDLAYIPDMDSQKGCVAINPSTNLPEIVFADQLTNGKYDPSKYASPMSQGFYNYVNGNDYLKSREGNFTERNGAQTPWNNRLDLRLMHDFNFYEKRSAANVDPQSPATLGKKHTLQLSWDIINFTNLLNPNWGWNYFVPNTINSTVDVGLAKAGVMDASGKAYGVAGSTGVPSATTIGNTGSNPGNYTTSTYTPIFNYSSGGNFTWDQMGSRWQMQIGIRYIF